MSSQTHKKPQEDAAKKRREYLWQKWRMYCWALFGLLALVRVFVSLLDIAEVRSKKPSMDAAVTIALSAAVLTTLGAAVYRKAHDEAKVIPFVPPVAEQIANLPADEVLLRGSDQPASVPGELLRAAQEGTEIGPDELLRASGK